MLLICGIIWIQGSEEVCLFNIVNDNDLTVIKELSSSKPIVDS